MFFPTADPYRYHMKIALPEGVTYHDFAFWKNGERVTLMARKTGEKRRPNKGEWFLSGAEVEAYYAPSTLDGEYHIAVIVPTKKRIIIEEV